MTLIVFKNISQFVKFWKLRVLTVLACPKSVCLSVFRLLSTGRQGGAKNEGHKTWATEFYYFFLNWPYSSNMRSERSSVRGAPHHSVLPPRESKRSDLVNSSGPIWSPC